MKYAQNHVFKKEMKWEICIVFFCPTSSREMKWEKINEGFISPREMNVER